MGATPPAALVPRPAAAGILSGSMDGALIRLALPIFVGYLFQIGFNYADTYFVGRLGSDALAGVLATMFTSWAMFALAETVTVGVLALLARAVGAGDAQRAGAVVACGAALGLALSVAVPTLGTLFLSDLVGLFNLEPGPAAAAQEYLAVVFLGYPALFGYFFFESVFRGSGNTRAPMLVLGGSFLLNIVLDPLLISGFQLGSFSFAGWGVTGAGVATIGSRGLGCLVLASLAWRARGELGLAKPDGPGRAVGGPPETWARLAQRIVTIGVPASAAGLTFCVIYFALLRITAQFGTPAVAALGLGIRLEGIGYFWQLALGRAVAAVVGQNLGAAQAERAGLAGRRALLWACVGTAPVAFVMLVFPEPVVRLFSDDPELVRAAVLYMQIVSWAMFPFGVEVVLNNLAAGAGDTVPAMAIGMTGTALRIPLALALVHLGWGYEAVWWSVSLTIVIKATCFVIWFKRGRWIEAGEG